MRGARAPLPRPCRGGTRPLTPEWPLAGPRRVDEDPAVQPEPDPSTARRAWVLYERIHAVTYFSEESAAAATEAGYRGFWMGYFAMRAAPLGAVGPDVVTAGFYGFHASRVARALPDAWSYAGPDRALRARLDGVDRTLQRIWGPDVDGPLVAEAADLAWQAAQAADVAGRVLGAANRALPRPAAPHLALWQATTTLREQRGDGHVAVLVALGLTPVEAQLVKIAADETDGPGLRRGRGWPDDDWSRGEESLRERGWLDPAGALTSTGADAHAEIERRTDEAAASPWQELGPDRTARLTALLAELVGPVVAAGVVPARNPIGVPLPDDGQTTGSRSRS